MSLRTLLYLYGWRLRAHPFQELLAGTGIAIGVALLFAVQVANTSIAGSVEQLLRAIVGHAQIELAARDEQGIDARLLDAVRRIPGVARAAPSIERRGVLIGPRGSEAIELIGADESLGLLGGTATRNFGPGRLTLQGRGIIIPDRLAEVTGVEPGQHLRLEMRGHVHRVRLAATLTDSQIGSLTGSSIAVTHLDYAQELTDQRGRLSRILVMARDGQETAVRRSLTALAAGRMDVGPSDSTVRRLRSATTPNDQAAALFSAISTMIGVLFAFNAMLLTMPDRRAFIAELRMQGFTPMQVVVALAFQAFVLGIAASVAGLLLGDLLSRTVFHAVPTYLAFTFPIGTQRIVSLHTVALAIGAGVLAALVAASRPLADVFSRRSLDAVFDERGDLGEGLDSSLRRKMLLVATMLTAVTTVAVLVAPRTTIVGVMVLAPALLLLIPTVFAAAVPLVEHAARRLRCNLLLVAVLGTRAAMTRSVAVAAIAALAVFGGISVGGARGDLIRGLSAGFADHVNTADIWITTVGRSLTTDSFSFSPREIRRLRATPEVAAVRTYQGGMLDLPGRRLWVVARPSDDQQIVPRTQVVSGDHAVAERRLRRGGWAAVSRTIVDERGLRIGEPFTMPTPTGPARLRLAAVVTNLGWGSGAMVINTSDYRRHWATEDASAIEIDLRSGVSAVAGKRAVERALGSRRNFDVESAAELRQEFEGILREGLTRLSQILTLLLVAAGLALSAAMSAAVWQRRQRLAAFKVQGFSTRQLRRVLLLETIMVLTLGCVVGGVVGVYGHFLGNRWLEVTTGFPAPFSLQGGQALLTLAAILCIAATIVAAASAFAVRVNAETSFRE